MKIPLGVYVCIFVLMHFCTSTFLLLFCLHSHSAFLFLDFLKPASFSVLLPFCMPVFLCFYISVRFCFVCTPISAFLFWNFSLKSPLCIFFSFFSKPVFLFARFCFSLFRFILCLFLFVFPRFRVCIFECMYNSILQFLPFFFQIKNFRAYFVQNFKIFNNIKYVNTVLFVGSDRKIHDVKIRKKFVENLCM